MNYNFSEDIKSIREILGLSQKELAEKLGVEQVTVSRVIR
ncbi:helix-turn-helix domain-containing protein [Dorea sp. AF36-15AT]|nr:helix-turn-helix domain-containing protein [Dorea sp. AF36-15AT]RHP09981.1 helix-turn-helix domain-containing protein [Dorea sp. AF36-15AT]